MSEHSHQSIALVTGCSSGIGRATATLLAERGWRVFATARCLETLNSIAHNRITPLRLDVTDEASMRDAVGAVLAQAGRIDALVNNAGYCQAGPMEELSPEQVRRQFETNTFGALRMAQLVLPTMRAQHSGRIVSVSTMGGRVVIPFIGLYNASKFALEAMSDALRMETRPLGVRVILIEPGGVRTNFNAAATTNARNFIAKTDSPYYRFLEPMFRFTAQAEAMSSPPETVAQVILHALTTERPHARYVATPDARIMLAILPRLSDGMRDALFNWLLGLREARAGQVV
jgi:NAD(P)-dependent dehydrogenase (short-subunit alcohol dehydrogenase family)